MEHFDGRSYARCYCTCISTEHVEKIAASRLGRLPVTFPGWKWGRPIKLPVVVFSTEVQARQTIPIRSGSNL
jgi:hypothetical protein